MDNQILLSVKNLKKYFPIREGLFNRNVRYLRALDDVTLDIKKGETLGLVGESGCGKSTAARTIIRIYNPTDGQIIFDGTDISHLSNKELMPYRKRMQMIFQDPYASLNARMTVRDIIGEPIEIHEKCSKEERLNRVYYLLDKVGLNKEHAGRYPHEFSGGQRQRIGIARALALNPEFIICDEPISALDVSIQAQVVNMLKDLQEEMGLTYLFIAHDLSMVRYISDRVGVMYLGRIVEIAKSDELYKDPLHPYTKGLLQSIPIPDPKTADLKKTAALEGDTSGSIDILKGCRFRKRCQYAFERCREEEPLLTEINGGHMAACHLYNK